jgi:Asp/Glu/hydantoin racemase
MLLKQTHALPMSSTVLIINPNSSTRVTESLKDILDPPPDVTYKFFTATDGPAEVNSHTTEVSSAAVCFEALKDCLDQHDAFLVACFGEHPLIEMLREHTDKPVVGIFQASVLQSLAFGDGKFAIITTASRWQRALDDGVLALLGSYHNYAGTFTTGLGVLELHEADGKMVESKIADATKSAVACGAKTLILGCAGMSGMEEIVKTHAPENTRVLDAVVSGCEMVVGLMRTAN